MSLSKEIQRTHRSYVLAGIITLIITSIVAFALIYYYPRIGGGIVSVALGFFLATAIPVPGRMDEFEDFIKKMDSIHEKKIEEMNHELQTAHSNTRKAEMQLHYLKAFNEEDLTFAMGLKGATSESIKFLLHYLQKKGVIVVTPESLRKKMQNALSDKSKYEALLTTLE